MTSLNYREPQVIVYEEIVGNSPEVSEQGEQANEMFISSSNLWILQVGLQIRLLLGGKFG